MGTTLTAATLAVTSIGNAPVDRDTFIKRMRDFGRAHGTGANSRPAAPPPRAWRWRPRRR
jgi:hypothetical protein